LREAVRGFESEAAGGVPARSYEQYLETFESYNSAVPVWEERADSLRARWASCRDLTERHNALIDSLRTVVAS
jgi:hypothetical protein